MAPKLALLAIAATTLAFAGCSTTPTEDPALLFGRFWLEGEPGKPTDYVHGMLVLEEPMLGLFSKSSAYDFHFEQFDYTRGGGALKLTFPQAGRSAEMRYTVTACKTVPPFDLCLDVRENPWGGPKRYYAVKSQDADSAAGRAARAQLGKR